MTGDEPMQHIPVEEPEGDIVPSRTSEVDLRHDIDAARQTGMDLTGA